MRVTEIKSGNFNKTIINAIIELFNENSDVKEITCNKGDDELMPTTFYVKDGKLYYKRNVLDNIKIDAEVKVDSFHRYDYLHYAKAIYKEMEVIKSYPLSDEEGNLLYKGEKRYQGHGF